MTRCGEWLRHQWPLLAIVVMFIILEVFFLARNPLLLWDEPVYLSNARGHLEDSHFGEDFRFPLLEFAIAGVWVFTGVSVLAAQLLIVGFSVAAVVLFWVAAGMVVSGRWFRVGATAAFAFSNLLLYWGFRVYTDVPAAALLLGSVVLFLRYEELGDCRLLLFSGVFMGLSFLMRFPNALLVFAFLPFLVGGQRWRGLLSFVVGGAVVVAPWMVANWARYGDPFWDVFAQAGVIGAYVARQPVGLFFGHVAFSLGLLLLFLVPFAWSLRRRPSRNHVFVGLLVLAAFVLGLANPLKLPRYLVLTVPLLLLACAVGAEAGWRAVGVGWRRVAAVVMVSLVVVQVAFGFVDAVAVLSGRRACYAGGAAAQAISFAEENIPEGDLIISNSWPWYGFYGNHRARSTWSDDVSLVLGEDEEGWLFVHSRGGLDPSGLVFDGSLVSSFNGSCDGTVDAYFVRKSSSVDEVGDGERP
ncbi:glycosyltransferase family 39 protein [Candidatus Woesearchaeota archaeon]|nr:glycosyltransferase family 39 protein [Candidatus Woesearchaeota archaeon]